MAKRQKKEVAAYMLDHDHFAGVPRTFQIELMVPFISQDQTEDITVNFSGDSENPWGVTVNLESDWNQWKVLKILPGQQADQSGLRIGDQLLSVDNRTLSNSNSKSIKNKLMEGVSCKLIFQRQKIEYIKQWGSLQEYKINVGSTEDVGSSQFTTDQVHRIGTFDVRILNLDRHVGNILVSGREKQKQYTLIPIDHGFILPNFKHISDINFEWLYWSQSKHPFSETTRAYISKVNPIADFFTLKNLGIREESCMSCYLSTSLLQLGAQEGLTLFEISNLLQRNGYGQEKSTVEKIIDQAKRIALTTTPTQQTNLTYTTNKTDIFTTSYFKTTTLDSTPPRGITSVKTSTTASIISTTSVNFVATTVTTVTTRNASDSTDITTITTASTPTDDTAIFIPDRYREKWNQILNYCCNQWKKKAEELKIEIIHDKEYQDLIRFLEIYLILIMKEIEKIVNGPRRGLRLPRYY